MPRLAVGAAQAALRLRGFRLPTQRRRIPTPTVPSSFVTSSHVESSSRKGSMSRSSVSYVLSNHEVTAMAFPGWKRYDAGELSMMTTSVSLRPSMERSLT
eukprot:Amastigsp_a847343_28.p3 type:complete len:100 gc:universal Amastigsp_a847343_28:931-632(-)